MRELVTQSRNLPGEQLSDHAFIVRCLDMQHRGEFIPKWWHIRLIHLVDDGKLGMDGFKYCWPEVAKENRRKMLACEGYRWSEATMRKRLSA